MIEKNICLVELDNLEIRVNNIGDIFTTRRNKIRANGKKDNREGRKLKPALNKYGYLKIVLTNNGKRKDFLVHRLVARAFLNNYDEELQVNHINGIKTDNRVENIEMVSLQQNIKHSIETGLKPKLKRDKYGRFVGKEVV